MSALHSSEVSGGYDGEIMVSCTCGWSWDAFDELGVSYPAVDQIVTAWRAHLADVAAKNEAA